MRYLTCVFLIALGIFFIWLSQNESKNQNKIETDLDKRLEEPIKLHDKVNKFEMMVLGIFSLALGVLFLLSELGLIDISISD